MVSEAQSLGVPVSTNRRQIFRGVVNFEGSLGENWSWSAYFQHGTSRVLTLVLNNVFTPNYNRAIDAVFVTAANVGSSGLQVGSIACRWTLSDPSDGCHPLNLFGIGVAFKIYYVTAWRNGQTNLLQSSLTRAIFFSALTTATAFGSLWLSSHPGTSSMGKLLALSLVCTLIGAVFFQPVLMGKPREPHVPPPKS